VFVNRIDGVRARRVGGGRQNIGLPTGFDNVGGMSAARAFGVVSVNHPPFHGGKRVFEEAKQTDNPLAKQVLSGARGSVSQLNMLIGGQMLQQDHRGRDIPFPVTHTFTEGLTPAEWYAIAYSSRKGLVGTKLGTAKSGFFAKQLNQINPIISFKMKNNTIKFRDLFAGLGCIRLCFEKAFKDLRALFANKEPTWDNFVKVLNENDLKYGITLTVECSAETEDYTDLKWVRESFKSRANYANYGTTLSMTIICKYF
jgi:hypothetical protein